MLPHQFVHPLSIRIAGFLRTLKNALQIVPLFASQTILDSKMKRKLPLMGCARVRVCALSLLRNLYISISFGYIPPTGCTFTCIFYPNRIIKFIQFDISSSSYPNGRCHERSLTFSNFNHFCTCFCNVHISTRINISYP